MGNFFFYQTEINTFTFVPGNIGILFRYLTQEQLIFHFDFFSVRSSEMKMKRKENNKSIINVSEEPALSEYMNFRKMCECPI